MAKLTTPGKLIMTRGLPASGKSTWAAKQEGFVVIEKDQIRKDLEKGGWKWSQSGERDVLNLQARDITRLLEHGKNVIAADTNFGEKHENRLKHIATYCGAEFAVRDFTDVPLEVCLERNSKRENPVPESFIKEQYAKYIEPFKKVVPVEYVDGLPRAILCDLDGTLAVHDGRSPYDTAKCGTDKLNSAVRAALEAFEQWGARIVFVSGREEKFRPETEAWLSDVAGMDGSGRPDGYDLHMRPTGDNRNDAIIKNEIFDDYIRGNWNIVCVLDDRDRVVKRWRELGLACFQVNYGNF